jgi:hypothetical protein
MGKEQVTEGKGNPQENVREKWFKQQQRGVWILDGEELRKALAWYKEGRRKKRRVVSREAFGKEKGPTGSGKVRDWDIRSISGR